MVRPTLIFLSSIALCSLYAQRLDTGTLRLQANHQARAAAAGLSDTQWSPIGAGGAVTIASSGGTTFQYPCAGRVSALAVDPRDGNTVYAGAASGGIWKTTDGGQSWTPLTDTQVSLATGSIALDPANPDTVYVGTGEEAFTGLYGNGILKSTDGGATWTNYPGPFVGPFSARDGDGGATIGALAVSPANSRVLIAGADFGKATAKSGIYRSTDAGVTWTLVLAGGSGTEALFDPRNANVAYAALGSPAGSSRNGVYKSVDGGVTWTASNGTASSALPLSAAGRIRLTIAPGNTSVVYAAVAHNNYHTADYALGVFKSTDGGQSWTAPNALDYCRGACNYHEVIRVHPSDPNLVVVGGLVPYRSMDGGVTWRDMEDDTAGMRLHADIHALAWTADGKKLYIGCDGGIFSTTNLTSSPNTWTPLSRTLSATQFYQGMSIHPTDPSIAYAPTQDNGVQKYSGGQWTNIGAGDGGRTLLDPTSANVIYFWDASDGLMYKSTDGGTTVTVIGGDIDRTRAPYQPPFVMDPSNPRRLYFGTYEMWVSNDAGAHWSAISGDLTGTGPIAALALIAVAPSDPNTIYVALSGTDLSGNDHSLVLVSTNALAGAGSTWIDRTAGLPQRIPTQVFVDPSNPSVAYASFSGFSGFSGDKLGHIFKTTDGGVTWTDISGDLPNIPVRDVLLDPDLPSTLYAGADTGVYRSVDGGAHWKLLGSGLPRVQVTSLILHERSRTLRAATYGRGVWDLSVPVPCAFTISPGGQAFPAAGGNGTISITGTPSAACAWSVSNVPSWLSFTGVTSGWGSLSLSYEVAPNSGGDLAATLTVAGLLFTIQVAAASMPGAVNVGSLAQIASAQGWDTAIELINMGSTAAQARLNFFADTSGSPLQLPFTFPQMPPAPGPMLGATLDETIGAKALLVLDTTGPASQAVSVGSAQLQAAGNLAGFGVFINASANWEAAVPLETRNAASYILAFDNTGSLATGLAIANLSAQAGNVNVVIRDDKGAQIGTPQSIALAAHGHTSFMLNAAYKVTAGIRGTIEFDTPAGGQISVLGLRWNGPALTTVPVLANVTPGAGSIGHVTYNGGWQTAITLVNTGAASTTPTLSFFDDNGNPLPVPFGATPPSATLTPSLAPGQSLILQTQGQDALDSVSGSAVLTSSGNVSGFAVFRNTASGQEAVVPLETRRATSYMLAYDNTNGRATGVALANTTGQPANLTVTVRDDQGTVLQSSPLTLAAHGHTAFMLVNAYPPSAGKLGTVQIDGPAGFSALGLFFTPAGNVTTLPVFAP